MVHPKKSSRGCLTVRPDTNANADTDADDDADANRSKTICRPPLKGGRHNYQKPESSTFRHFFIAPDSDSSSKPDRQPKAPAHVK